MFAIIGEDKSDVGMLNALVRRISGIPNMTIKRMGFNGCADMINKGARQLKAYSKIGCTHFVICYDSDGDDVSVRYQKIVTDVIKASGVKGKFCALIPVQELESWILADIAAVSNVIPSWKPTKSFHHPETYTDPKEYLEKLSRTAQHKPLYNHVVHNERVAEYLCLKSLVEKCPSALPLFEIVKIGNGNHPLPSKEQAKEIRLQILANFEVAAT